MTHHLLFPISVLQNSLGRELSYKEINFLSSQNKFVASYGNDITYDKYILDNPCLKDLKVDLNNKIQEYIDKIYKPKSKIKSYITQSWINITDPGKWHHKHDHSNSFLSGVFYLSVEKQTDKIFFYKRNYDQISIESFEWDQCNSKHWFLNVSPLDVVVFPSDLIHDVQPTLNNLPRISLAFNSFIEGMVGSYHDSTELILPSK